MTPDPNTCDHEWVSDGDLEVYPPIATSHCVKCGLRRRIKSSTGEVTYYPPVETGNAQPAGGGPHDRTGNS